jgi:hypothetical protein
MDIRLFVEDTAGSGPQREPPAADLAAQSDQDAGARVYVCVFVCVFRIRYTTAALRLTAQPRPHQATSTAKRVRVRGSLLHGCGCGCACAPWEGPSAGPSSHSLCSGGFRRRLIVLGCCCRPRGRRTAVRGAAAGRGRGAALPEGESASFAKRLDRYGDRLRHRPHGCLGTRLPLAGVLCMRVRVCVLCRSRTTR